MTRRRVGVAVVALTMTAMLGLAACGGDDDGRSSGGGSATTGTTGTTDAGAAAYVGLSKRAAIAKADAGDTPWRITREDDESFMVTQDYVPERLNFEIDDGTVTSATYG